MQLTDTDDLQQLFALISEVDMYTLVESLVHEDYIFMLLS